MEGVDSFAHNKNAAKIAREEAELAKLIRQHQGIEDDEDNDDGVQQEASEEATEEESGSSKSESETVRSKSDTKQKEKSKTEAQEDDDLSAEEKTFKQRYSDIRKYMQQKEIEHKAELEKLNQRLDQVASGSVSELTTKEQVAEWAKQNPKANALIRALAEEQASEQLKSVEQRLREVEQIRVQAKKEKAEAELYSLHPDFDDIRDNNDFHKWATEQPDWAKKALYDVPEEGDEDFVYDVKSVSRVLDLYKADKGIKTKRVAQDRSAASSVKSRNAARPEADATKGTWYESDIAKLTDKQFEKHAEEIEKARISGKIIYDVSKR